MEADGLKSEDLEQRLARLNEEVVRLYEQGRYEQAVAFAKECCDLCRGGLGETHPAFAASLNNLAVLYEGMGSFAAVEPLRRQALEIHRKALGEEHPDFAQSLNDLALLYRAMGSHAAAEPLARQALEIRRKVLGEEHPDFAQSLNNLALLCHSMGNYAAAEPLYRQALEIRRRVLGEEHPDFATNLYNLAGLCESMGNYAVAEQFYHQALEIRHKALGEGHWLFAESVDALGQLYIWTGNYAAAQPLFRRALEIRRKALGEEHPHFAESLNNLAVLDVSMGNYAEAEPLLRRALEIRRKALGEEHRAFAQSLSSLAALHLWMGNYAAAEPLYRQALEIARRVLGEEHPDFAQSLNDLAVLSVARRRENEALALMLQAAAIEDRMIGQVFSISSESQRMVYIKTIQNNVDVFLSLVLGHMAGSTEAVRAAVGLILRRKAIGAEALAAQRDAVLGGKYPALVQSLRELTTLRMQIAQKTLAGPGVEGIEIHRKQLAEWNTRKERLEADLARQIPEMNVEGKLRTAEHRVVGLALPAGAALVEFVRFNVFDFRAVPAQGEGRWKPARYLAFILTLDEPDNVQMIDLGEAEAVDQMIATFRVEITGQSERRGRQDVQDRPALAPRVNQVLELRTLVFDPLVVALGGCKRLLVAPDGDLSRLPFEVLPTSDGRRLIDDYHISYLGAGRDVLRFRAAKSGRPRTPVVVADPDLDLEQEAVALRPPRRAEVTPDALNSKVGFWSRLIARERVVPALPSSPAAQPTLIAATVARQSRDLDPRTLHFEPLPGTRVEGEHVAKILGVRPWLGEAALEAPLKACNSPRILHLATHGFFLPDKKWDPNRDRGQPLRAFGGAAGTEPSRVVGPGLENPLLRSGLALAGANTWCRGGSLPPEAEDGILTAEDVSGLNLLDTDLVVLSACETGLGEVRTGEGVFGLRRAFVLAGTKGLVMSLWKVPDEETRKLMEHFYQRIIKEQPGQSHAEALRAAQLAMKEEYPDPLYWGAFIYEGDPSLAFRSSEMGAL